MKVTYIERMDLSEKAVFILQELYGRPNNSMNYAGDDDYLHRDRYVSGKYGVLHEHGSMAKAFITLIDLGLLEKADDGSEYSYIAYRLTQKALQIYPQIQYVDTSEWHQYRSPYAQKWVDYRKKQKEGV